MELAITVQVVGSLFILLCLAWWISNWRNESKKD